MREKEGVGGRVKRAGEKAESSGDTWSCAKKNMGERGVLGRRSAGEGRKWEGGERERERESPHTHHHHHRAGSGTAVAAGLVGAYGAHLERTLAAKPPDHAVV